MSPGLAPKGPPFCAVWSNVAAVITGAIASSVHKAWFIDSIGGILISLAIILRWFMVIQEQARTREPLSARARSQERLLLMHATSASPSWPADG